MSQPASESPPQPSPSPKPKDSSRWRRFKRLILGDKRDVHDESMFHRLTLVALLAWVGLGADGLSSSCYGPAEAFTNLGDHTYLAVLLAIATIGTVGLISLCYSHIIEEFPRGGGGYVVASKLLGKPVGAVSGCALLVDYVLTITVSIAAAGDALFGLMPPEWLVWKLPAETGVILFLTLLNLRGVKESVMFLLPIFLVFLLTHLILILGVVGLNLKEVERLEPLVVDGFRAGMNDPNLGLWGMAALFLHAYSLGAGTYTGIEAVSNSMPIMREPRVATAKRTMLYMALSLAFTAGGLLLGYLLLQIAPRPDQTMNQSLAEAFMAELGLDGWSGHWFVLIMLISEGALLIAAAQAGFTDGPRVLANMARDSWLPHWFANLSEQLTTHNGILLMGGFALGALLYTGGHVSTLVVMYSINVFLTFSLSMVAMCGYWIKLRGQHPLWRRRLCLFAVGAVVCVFILGVTTIEKFEEGGWRTLMATGACIAVCFAVRRHYHWVYGRMRKLDQQLAELPGLGEVTVAELDPSQPTAAILVGSYSGLGVHTLLGAYRFAPGYYKNFLFLSVGVLDSGNFKGPGAVESLKAHTEESLAQYAVVARRLGLPASCYSAYGIDTVEELEKLCRTVSQQFPRTTFFAGQLVFKKDTWYQRLLHNESAFQLQRRLQLAGLPIVILPTRVR